MRTALDILQSLKDLCVGISLLWQGKVTKPFVGLSEHPCTPAQQVASMPPIREINFFYNLIWQI